MVSAVIVAAGKGERMGAGMNKAYLPLDGKTVIELAVAPFEECGKIGEIIVVTDDVQKCGRLLSEFSKVKAVVSGGKTRSESVKNGLYAAKGDICAIHDGARALITKSEIESVIDAGEEYGAAALGVKCKDTVKVADKDGFIKETPNRDFLYQIQTPQVFKTAEILKMHEAKAGGFTDDCAVAESFGKRIKIVMGSYENIKITTPEDLAIAESILKKRSKK